MMGSLDLKVLPWYFLMVAIVHCLTWQTEEQEHFALQCPPNQVVTRIASTYFLGDRLWNITCGPVTPAIEISDCSWTGYINGPGQTINFSCPKNSVVTGLSSYYQSKDRIYNFYCCTNEHYLAHECRYTVSLNYYNGYLKYNSVPPMVLRGFYSFYSTSKADRRFYAEVCQLDPAYYADICHMTDVTISRLVQTALTPSVSTAYYEGLNSTVVSSTPFHSSSTPTVEQSNRAVTTQSATAKAITEEEESSGI